MDYTRGYRNSDLKIGEVIVSDILVCLEYENIFIKTLGTPSNSTNMKFEKCVHHRLHNSISLNCEVLLVLVDTSRDQFKRDSP